MPAHSLIITPAEALELVRTPDEPPSDKYRQVGVIKHPDGILIRFTERIDTGRISAGLFRFFKDGQDERESAFFGAQHIVGAHRLLDRADEYMLTLEAEALQRRASTRAANRR